MGWAALHLQWQISLYLSLIISLFHILTVMSIFFFVITTALFAGACIPRFRSGFLRQKPLGPVVPQCLGHRSMGNMSRCHMALVPPGPHDTAIGGWFCPEHRILQGVMLIFPRCLSTQNISNQHFEEQRTDFVVCDARILICKTRRAYDVTVQLSRINGTSSLVMHVTATGFYLLQVELIHFVTISASFNFAFPKQYGPTEARPCTW